MKLAYLRIQNFKGIADFEIDFRDELGRIRDLTLLVGPNGSGKTAILDSIWFGLQGIFGYRLLKPNFRPESKYIVREGAQFAQITYEVYSPGGQMLISERLEKEEDITQFRAMFGSTSDFSFDVTYPAQANYQPEGKYRIGYKGENLYWRSLKNMSYLERANEKNPQIFSVEEIARFGDIYLFNQERAINDEPVYKSPLSPQYHEEENIRVVLVKFAIQEFFSNSPDKPYSRVQELYNAVCAPRRMGKMHTNDPSGEFQFEFWDEHENAYSFDGLSSGEKTVLNFIIQYVARRIQNSIVLIDELELYLHPTWQQRLLQNLKRINDGNQFIITTHSPTVRQAVWSDAVIELGQLGDSPDWQLPKSEVSPIEETL